MARKKPTPPSNEGPKRRGRSRPEPEPAPAESVGPGSFPSSSKPKPTRPLETMPLHIRSIPAELEQARALAVRAAEALDPRRSLALAKQAVEKSPDCAEGYIVLAEHARARKEALAMYERAVAAAGRVLGSEFFDQFEGMFWGLIETRPYMRARLGLAEALWASGHRAEAAEHLEAMLRLNPNDNQGLRYILAGWLLNLDRLDDLEGLLGRYDESSATWAYTRTLVTFRRKGDSPEARKLLTAAKKSNRHVPDFLLGRKMLPPEQPSYYSPGDESDAILYVGHNLSAWKSTPARSPGSARRSKPRASVSRRHRRWSGPPLKSSNGSWDCRARWTPGRPISASSPAGSRSPANESSRG